MQFLRIDELLDWMSDAYGYDIDSLKANTQKDDIRKANREKIEKIKNMITINQPTNELP